MKVKLLPEEGLETIETFAKKTQFKMDDRAFITLHFDHSSKTVQCYCYDDEEIRNLSFGLLARKTRFELQEVKN